MKKFLSIIILLCLSIFNFMGCAYNRNEDNGIIYNYEDVKDILIRFHVIANSDSDEDQALKLKVKDKIINYLYPLLEKSKSLEESREILLNQEDKVKEIAINTINENGYNYNVNIELSKENFPEKSYGSVILPQGEYEAFRVIIGNGNGQNWWCVMFPPLCFIDITTGKIQDEKSKSELDREVEKGEDKDNSEEVQVKSKIVEIFNKYIK